MKNYFVALAFTALFLPVACACGTPDPARSGDGDPDLVNWTKVG